MRTDFWISRSFTASKHHVRTLRWAVNETTSIFTKLHIANVARIFMTCSKHGCNGGGMAHSHYRRGEGRWPWPRNMEWHGTKWDCIRSAVVTIRTTAIVVYCQRESIKNYRKTGILDFTSLVINDNLLSPSWGTIPDQLGLRMVLYHLSSVTDGDSTWEVNPRQSWDRTISQKNEPESSH